jgi:Sugar phosphate isomerases/epimerases
VRAAGRPGCGQPFSTRYFRLETHFEDQPRLTDHAFQIAKKAGARIIRVFSYWRTVEPDKCFTGVVKALTELAEKAAKEDLIIGLENEHACNIGTAQEAARVLDACAIPT